MKLTAIMKAQLLEYCKDIKHLRVYWGNSEQFWNRHKKIVEWLKEQPVRKV